MLLLVVLTGCTNHGKKVKSGHIEVYYKDDITEAAAQKTASLLEMVDKAAGNDISIEKSFQLVKKGDTATLRMVVREEKVKDVRDEDFYGIMNLIGDSVLGGKPVNMDLTDRRFKSFHLITYKKADRNEGDDITAQYGAKTNSGNVEVYYKDFSEEWANDLAGYFNETMKPPSVISFQATKNTEGFYVINMATTQEKVKRVTEQQMQVTARNISDKIMAGAPLIFQMTDVRFEPLKTIRYKTDEHKIDTIQTP